MMMAVGKPGPPPSIGWRDRGRDATDAAIAAVPFVGGSLQILFDDVLQPSLEKRRQAWFRKLGEVVDELSRRFDDFNPAHLDGNENFVSAVMQASRIAMTTHRDDKLAILKDCLINLVVPGAPSDLTVSRFLRFVDLFEPEHFLVLRYATSPEQWYADKQIPRGTNYVGAPSTILGSARLPVAGLQLQLVLRDLDREGLANTASLNTMMTEQGMWQSFATDLGVQLVAFATQS
jgi:hypothetical protein